MKGIVSKIIGIFVPEQVCLNIADDYYQPLRVVDEFLCKTRLEWLHYHYLQVIKGMELSPEHPHTRCSKQQLGEAKWLTRAKKYEAAIKIFWELKRDLNDSYAQETALLQDDVGSFGGCSKEWFFKLEYSLDEFDDALYESRPLPKRPVFLDEINSPVKLRQMFEKYPFEYNPPSGLYGNRKALNCLTGLVKLLYKMEGFEYKFHPELKKTLENFLDNNWQDSKTGFWGVWEGRKGESIFHPDLSITFHIIGYRMGKVKRWPQIIETLLKMKYNEYPEGWIENGKISHHHICDVAKIMKYGWAGCGGGARCDELRSIMKKEIEEMLRYSVENILRDDYDFEASAADEVEEAIAYHVFFLEQVGYLNFNDCFWADKGNVPYMESQREVIERLIKRIEELNYMDNQELEDAYNSLVRYRGRLSSNSPLSGQFAADISLLRPWDGKTDVIRPPYIVRFQKGNKQLSYVAASHDIDLNSETFKKIRKEFSAFKPEVVIVEDLETSMGISPKWFVNSYPLGRKIWKCGEPCYTAGLAFQNNIPYIGGEPDDLTVTETLRQKGYTDRDILGFLLVRQVPQWLGDSKRECEPFDLERLLEYEQDRFVIGSFLDEEARFASPDDFEEWHKEKNGIELVTDDESSNIVAPMDGPYFTQKMALEEGIVRDANITSTIARMLNMYDKVMIVYGAGHLYMQRLVLEDMFK